MAQLPPVGWADVATRRDSTACGRRPDLAHGDCIMMRPTLPAAERWTLTTPVAFATCPVTQGSLMRFLVREGASGVEAGRFLWDLLADARHRFWPDDLAYDRVDLGAVVGHRQVTDAYLAALARAQGGRLATFDRALAAVHADVTDLVPA